MLRVLYWTSHKPLVNTLRLRRNRHYFADDIFKFILLNENVLISIKISLKFIPKGPINNLPALAQIMAWCCPGDKPLSDPMMIILLAHICVTWPKWVNSLGPGDAMWQRIWSTLVQVMACCLMAPSNCLNQFWLIINEILWHSPVGNFTVSAQDISPS